MTTTTITTIFAKVATVVAALTPAAISSRPFQRATFATRPLRRWIPSTGPDGMLRMFEVRGDGDEVPIGIQDPGANLVSAAISVTVAYPAQPKLYSYAELYEIEGLIAGDARQIRDAIIAPTGLADGGHQASLYGAMSLDRSDDRIWYQTLDFDAVYYTAQRL